MSRDRQGSVAVEGFDASDQLQGTGVVVEARRARNTDPRLPPGHRLLRVLVVDDDRDTVDSLTILVKLWGYDVRSAYDGAQILEIASRYQPDVMLLDVAMPKVDGLQLARHLRGQARFKDTLLAAITGYADEAHRVLCAEAGFDDYLVKPADPSLVEQLLLRQQARLAKELGRSST
jgi:DNA-binding response OmpR family regulator